MSTTEYKRTPLTPAAGLIIFVGGGLLLGGFLGIRHLWEAHHPAVSEHRTELVETAAKKMSCEPGGLKIVAEEPTIARVEGCNRSVTFRWGRVRSSDLPVHWLEIDPNCRVSFLGFDLRCQ